MSESTAVTPLETGAKRGPNATSGSGRRVMLFGNSFRPSTTSCAYLLGHIDASLFMGAHLVSRTMKDFIASQSSSDTGCISSNRDLQTPLLIQGGTLCSTAKDETILNSVPDAWMYDNLIWSQGYTTQHCSRRCEATSGIRSRTTRTVTIWLIWSRTITWPPTAAHCL